MPGMGINILPSLRPDNSNLLINGNFDTPLLNGALFHQFTFRTCSVSRDYLSPPVCAWIMRR